MKILSFWQFWVPNTDCYLTRKIGKLGLVNGSPMKTHSLTFEDETELKRIQELVDATQFGEEIEIKEPLSVNMTVVESSDNKPVSEKRQKQLDVFRKLSIVTDGTIVIPITRTPNSKLFGKSKKDKNKFVYPTDCCLISLHCCNDNST